MGSPSASDAVKNAVTGTEAPVLTLPSIAVTSGGVSPHPTYHCGQAPVAAPSEARTDTDSARTLEPATYATWPRLAALTLNSALAGMIAPLRVKYPPWSVASSSRKVYCVMASPSGSLTVNRVEAATVAPACSKVLAGVTTGALLPLDMFQPVHALYAAPSLARTHTISVPAAAPPTNCTLASCAALTSIAWFAPCLTPLNAK